MSEHEMNYMAKFSLDTSDLLKGITGAAISFDAITMAAKEAFEIIKEGYEMTINKALEFAETIESLSDVTGESQENIQRLRGAAVATGTDFEAVSTTIRTFSQRLGDSGSAGDSLRQKLSDIGVAVRDSNGQYRSAADLYMEINQQLGDMEDVYARNNLAMDIYGRNWYNIADMITKADKAATAYKLVDPISDADIEKAKEFSIQLGVIGDHINMIGVDIGMKVLDDPRIQLLVGKVDPDSVLGKLLGMTNNAHDDNGAGADRDPNQKLKEQTAALEPLIDKYKDMSTLQVEYITTSAEMQKAQASLDYELAHGTQESVDKASLALVNLKQKYEDVRRSMAAVASQASATNASLNPYADNPSSGGGDPGTMNGPMNEDLQANLSSTSAIWAYAKANTDQSYQSDTFLSRIRGIAAGAQSIQLPGGADWTHTSENQSIIGQTASLWAQYQQQKEGQKGFTQINYIQGDNAQSVANAIASQTNTILAQQVLT